MTTARHALPADEGFPQVGIDDHSVVSPVSKPKPSDYVKVDDQCIEGPEEPDDFRCSDATQSRTTHLNGSVPPMAGYAEGQAWAKPAFAQ